MVPSFHRQMYEPTPMPKHVPHVAELGITSAPLKSASFLMGTYCKDYTGQFELPFVRSFPSLQSSPPFLQSFILAEDFMLCRGESQDPAHCLQEGRRVTRCGTDL